jgi:hypothetical protein
VGRFRDKPAARLGALALRLGASLAASDAALRSAWLSPRQFRLDAELGLDRPPFAEVLVGREGGARLRFDHHGLNNDAAAWDRPGPRVAILGDSFVEAVEVPRAENAVARLAAALPGATVLNLGRAAATPPQAVALLRRLAARGERFDLVVLALSDNDLGDMAASAVGPGCAVAAHPPGLRRRVTAAVVQESPLLMRLQSRAREWGRTSAGRRRVRRWRRPLRPRSPPRRRTWRWRRRTARSWPGRRNACAPWRGSGRWRCW